MLKQALITFKNTIAGAIGPNKVSFVNLQGGNDCLVDNQVNVVLFTSRERKDLLGLPQFAYAPPHHNGREHQHDPKEGLLKQSPLRLDLNLLLIFNLNKFETALDAYEQVVALFYQQQHINSAFEGFPYKVEVNSSGFDDHSEIEMRESFRIPGTPILRYGLSFAMVPGSHKKAGAITKVGASGSVMHHDGSPDATLVSFVLDPVQDEFENILSKLYLHKLDSRESTSRNALQRSGTALLKTFEKSLTSIESVAKDKSAERILFVLAPLVKALREKESAIKQLLVHPGQVNRVELGESYTNLLSQKEAELKTLQKLFSAKVHAVSQCLQWLEEVNLALREFNALSASFYRLRQGKFELRSSLSSQQVSQKRQLTPMLARRLQATYEETQKKVNEQISSDEASQPDFGPLKKALTDFGTYLDKPIALWLELNDKFDPDQGLEGSDPTKSQLTHMADEVREYTAAYEKLWIAVNLPGPNPARVPEAYESHTERLLLAAVEQSFNQAHAHTLNV